MQTKIMHITKKDYGITLSGEAVYEYTMTNTGGASVSVITYGGVITKIIVPDKDGNLSNIVVGFDSVSGYENCPNFIGTAVGRSAGRISDAKLVIDDTVYELEKNNGNNNLHGGSHALDKKVWAATQYSDDTKASITLHYLSPDLEEGFPGNLDCYITYTFTNDNALTIKYLCTTDKKTFVNMTNHSYFNLSGDFSTKILDHTLQIPCDQLLAVNSEIIPQHYMPVDGTPFDFRKAKPIGQDIDKEDEQLHFGTGYDHAFPLNKNAAQPNIIAQDPKTGRTMTISTTESCVVFYSGNSLSDKFSTYGQIPLHDKMAFCLETQYYPDANNASFLESRYLSPEEKYIATTTFTFTA